MNNVAKLHQLCTKTGLAAEFEIDKKRVFRLLKGVPADGRTDKGYDGYHFVTVVPFLFQQPEVNEDGDDQFDPAALPPRERKIVTSGNRPSL